MTIGAVALLVQLRRRIRWGWGMLSDGWLSRRHVTPDHWSGWPSAGGLHNGDPVPTKAWLDRVTTTGVPVRKHSSSSLEVNGTEVSGVNRNAQRRRVADAGIAG
ncbi:MAG: hypothetical protein IPI82_09295 [Candidatus Microthrix sp.]|nr:hypothetical protein [Candidatus Microthrix sp.]MBK7322627.1 hypothetical protein [Candidatus Microthrix sp.]